MHGTRVTKENKHLVASGMGISIEELNEKIDKSYREFKKKQDKEWAINFFRKDEAWYGETMKKVKQIASTLPKEQMKKMYGWIEPHRKLTIPLQCDMEYAHAVCVELILTNPDGYLKIIYWD